MTTLHDKVLLITGGASGIGRATVHRCAEKGASVIVADLNLEGAQQVADEVTANGGRARAVAVDVSDFAAVEQAVQSAVDAFGRLDGIFNNAGIAGGRPLLEHDPERDYHPMIRIDQDGVYYGILAAARQFVRQGGGGVIVNTSSIYGEQAAELSFSYSAAKAAVISFTRSAAYELAEHGTRVLAITPGRANTAIIQQFPQHLRELFASEQLRDTMTEPEEIANVVAFLFSEDSNAMNGTVVHVDDGYSVFKHRFELPVF